MLSKGFNAAHGISTVQISFSSINTNQTVPFPSLAQNPSSQLSYKLLAKETSKPFFLCYQWRP